MLKQTFLKELLLTENKLKGDFKMNIKNQIEKIKESLEGKTFEQLAEHFEEWEGSGYYNIDIDNMLMDLMIEADEDKFIAWAEEREVA